MKIFGRILRANAWPAPLGFRMASIFAISCAAIAGSGARADDRPDMPPTSHPLLGGALDISTLQFNFSSTDISLGATSEGRGLTLTRNMTESNGGPAGLRGAFGLGGSSSLAPFIFDDEGEKIVVFEGRSYRFGVGSNYEAFDGTGARLSGGGSEYIFIAPDGTKVNLGGGTCSPGCKTARYVVRPNGFRLDFSYEVTFISLNGLSSFNRVRSVRSSDGYEIDFTFIDDLPFDYNSGPSRIRDNAKQTVSKATAYSLACDSVGGGCVKSEIGHVSYYYDHIAPPTPTSPGAYVLSTFTDFAGKNWTYSRLSNPYYSITALNAPDGLGAPFSLGWNVAQETFTQTMADGRTWTASHYPCTTVDLCQGTKLRDPDNKETLYEWVYGGTDAVALIVGIRDPLDRVRRFYYDIDGRLIEADRTEGNKEIYTLDDRSNVIRTDRYPKPGSALSVISTTSAFDPCTANNDTVCNKPTVIKDSLGNYTRTTWSANSGGPLLERKGLDVNGNCKLSDCPSIEHQYTAFTGVGGVQVYLETMTIMKIDASHDRRIGYEYYPSQHLLLAGKVDTADGASVRTCYGYDEVGNKISETSPRGGLSQCS